MSCSPSVVLMLESEKIHCRVLAGQNPCNSWWGTPARIFMIAQLPLTHSSPNRTLTFSIDVLTSVAGLFFFFRICFFIYTWGDIKLSFLTDIYWGDVNNVLSVIKLVWISPRPPFFLWFAGADLFFSRASSGLLETEKSHISSKMSPKCLCSKNCTPWHIFSLDSWLIHSLWLMKWNTFLFHDHVLMLPYNFVIFDVRQWLNLKM